MVLHTCNPNTQEIKAGRLPEQPNHLDHDGDNFPGSESENYFKSLITDSTTIRLTEKRTKV